MARKDAQLTRNAERRFCQVVVCCSNPKTELPSAVPSFACGGGGACPGLDPGCRRRMGGARQRRVAVDVSSFPGAALSAATHAVPTLTLRTGFAVRFGILPVQSVFAERGNL